MKRRAILLASGAWLLAAAARSFPQASKAPRTIAVLIPGTQTGFRSRFDAFRDELRRLGYVEGRDILFEARWGNDRTESLALLAAELVSLAPAVIVTSTSAGVSACKAATSTIPIVFAAAGNPVEQGFVSSLRRPGGNVTGVLVYLDLGAKIVEVAREALPEAQRLAIVIHESDPAHKLMLDVFLPAAKRFKFEALVVRVKRPEELARSFNEIASWKADAIYLPQQAFIPSNGRRLVELSREVGLPLLSGYEEITTAGGLLSYGHTREESYRRAATLVDKVLRGARPAELPVEQPERVQLVVNLKTANSIGVKLPQGILQRADRVIQ
jgi:putative ABC transport system substrate-binding protein